MRISPVTSQILLNALNVSDKAEEKALTQLTTGRRVNVASDNPGAAAVEVQISARSSSYDQYLQSIGSVSSELQVADSALNSAVTSLQRALTLGVQGANGTMSQPDRAALASDVQDIAQQLLTTANLTYNGKYLFAGTVSSRPPYVSDSSAPGGVKYQGNNGVNQVQTEDGSQVVVNQPGSELFSATGTNLFEGLSNLVGALQSSASTTQDISNATETLRQAFDHLNSSRVFYGNTMNELNSNETFLNAEKLQLSQQMNAVVGVDANEAATNLVNAESARSAALAAAARTSAMSLLDYLSNTSTG